jgi:hypothetical protein
MRLTIYLENVHKNIQPDKVFEYQEKVGGVMTNKKVIIPFPRGNKFKTTYSFKDVRFSKVSQILSMFSDKVIRKIQYGDKIMFNSVK